MNDLTPLQEGAAGQHELYRAWVEAGFTEDQALRLLIAMITAQFHLDNGGGG